MVGGEAVPQADADVAGPARGGVREGERLPAPRHGAPRLPLPRRVARAGSHVPLQNGHVILSAPLPLHGRGANLAHDHRAAPVLRSGATVRFVGSMLQTKFL